ncbi:hypothetical protein ASF06_12295 [Agreia sp. Leaf244]|nr:hypothetical protein ASF06_12295 [Agreia sp. Leaf244]
MTLFVPATPHAAATRRRAAVVATAGAILGIVLSVLVAPGLSASATETDPTPTPSPDSTVAIATPVIERPAASELVGDAITFRGTAEPSAGIDLYSEAGGQPLCSVVANPSGVWTCEVTLESTSSVTVRAVQTVDGQTSETSVQISVLNAPTAGPGGGGTVSSGTVMGSGLPGATVTAAVGGVSCTATVDSTGSWFCALPAGTTSGSYQLTASQVAPWSGGRSSASSAPTELTIDVDAPAPPAVTIPASPVPATGATFSGTGEDGATVTLFAGPHSLCQAVVTAGRWSCTSAAIDIGNYEVSAIQQDAAGNISTESARVSVAFGTAATATPAPTPQPNSSTPEPAPTSTVPPTPADGDLPAATPEQPQAQPDASAQAPTAVTPGGWSAATRFSAGMKPAFGSAGAIDWTLAFGIGLAMVALLAVPARLLAGTLRGLRSAPSAAASKGARLTGRNRSRHQEFESAPALSWNTRVTGAFALVATATITVLSAPVADEPAYLRLLVAVALGIVAVNAVAVLVPRLLARWVFDVSVDIRLRPIYLLVSVGATVLSRTLDLDPALVFGIVFGLALTAPASRRAQGRLAALQIGSLLVIGVTALLISGSFSVSAGTVGAFVAEFVNTVALASLGGAAFLLLPIANLPGRQILRWRRLVWLVLALAGFTLLAGVLSSALGGLGGGAGIILIALLSLVFAAVCVAVWLWVRFVRSPAHDESSTPSA